MLKVFLTFVAGLACVYLLLAMSVFFYQKRLIHIPFTAYAQTPEDRAIPYESVVLRQPAGDAALNGWLIDTPDSKYTVLLFSGNAGNMSYMLDSIEFFHQLGHAVFIYDYRGYGASTGKLTERAMYDDVRLAWEYLTEVRQTSPDNIIVFGRSLGTAMASWTASEYDPAALIMESGFTSLADLARIYYRWLPTGILLRFHYDNLSRISQVKSPTLFIHSPEDELIPYTHAQRLYAAATSEKALLTISGDHNYGYLDSGETYTGGIREFLIQFVY
ncbi:MAG: alpha/beta hydrolase [Acidiferrobacterales bacterium]|nr:alpha/beta hydrolase [Acidiferrobacterales bacterium]